MASISQFYINFLVFLSVIFHTGTWWLGHWELAQQAVHLSHNLKTGVLNPHAGQEFCSYAPTTPRNCAVKQWGETVWNMMYIFVSKTFFFFFTIQKLNSSLPYNFKSIFNIMQITYLQFLAYVQTKEARSSDREVYSTFCNYRSICRLNTILWCF